MKSGKIMHMCLDIQGAINWPNRMLAGLLADDEGKRLSADEARDVLREWLRRGHRVMPIGDPCEGFSYQTGCPGHEVEHPAVREAITT